MVEKHNDNNKHYNHHDNHHNHYNLENKSTRNIGIAFFLNFLFSIIEFIFGGLFNSYAIMADAVHDLGDAFSIGVSWALQKISTREPDHRYIDGYGRFSLLGSLFTGIVLIAGSTIMIILSVPRLINPEPVNYNGMFGLAMFAIAINVFAAYLMYKGKSKNEKMLTLHMLEDVLGWVAVLIVAFVLRFVDWYILDPILSISIAIFILYKTVPEFISSIKVFMNVVPEDMDLSDLKERIIAIENVNAAVNLHTHSIDGVSNIFSITLFVDTRDMDEIECIKDKVRLLLTNYNVVNATIEIVADVYK